MEQTLSPKQQAVDLITRAQSILIVSHRNPDGDSLGSMVALKLVLEKIGKTATIACSDAPGQIFSFLPKVSELLTKIDVSKDLVISVSLESAQLKKLGYKKIESEKRIEILITPESGRFEESNVTSHIKGVKYDLIISLDTPNLERLGTLAEPADLFYEVPVINIDHHPANERFGKVNWIELVATSTAEVLVSLIEALQKDKPLLDEEIATALLTGLIYDTSSFQNINTTPKSLTVAAQLVAAGGRQQQIVKNLYKTKTLETLKLWGTILQNVQEDSEARFIWSSVSKEEIRQAGSDESAISGILDELLKSATDVDLALLLSEREGQIHGSLRSIAKGINVSEIAELFGGGGHEVASAFRVEGNLAEKKETILARIRAFQKKEPLLAESQNEELRIKNEEKKSNDQNPKQIQNLVEETTQEKIEAKTEEKAEEKSRNETIDQSIKNAVSGRNGNLVNNKETDQLKIENTEETAVQPKPEEVKEPVISAPQPPVDSPFSFSAPEAPTAPMPEPTPEKPAEKKEPMADLSGGDSLTKW